MAVDEREEGGYGVVAVATWILADDEVNQSLLRKVAALVVFVQQLPDGGVGGCGVSHHLPGDKTRPHQHPDSVMYTLSGFRRRLHADQGTRDVVMEPGGAHWLPAQTHAGENIGATPTHVLFVELKEEGATEPAAAPGPA